MEDTVKDSGKYVVGMGKCVEVCVVLCRCMLRVWEVLEKMDRKS